MLKGAIEDYAISGTIKSQNYAIMPDDFSGIVPRLEKKEGETVEFDRVLLVEGADGAVKVGAPTVEGAKVVCEVKRPLVKGDKVIVFKKKRRNDYVRKNGHRQMFSQIVIKEVVNP